MNREQIYTQKKLQTYKKQKSAGGITRSIESEIILKFSTKDNCIIQRITNLNTLSFNYNLRRGEQKLILETVVYHY